jgi:hypothetical protein
MVKHIVMWKLKESVDGQSREQIALSMKSKLEGLVGLVPQIKALEVGINFAESDTASDISLYSEFESLEDLNAYQIHPEHQKVVAYVKTVVTERRVADYNV